MTESRMDDHHSVATVGAVFRTTAAMPQTTSARASLATWTRATQDAGYSAVAKVVGHDKSWVSRWFTEESRANLPELMSWLDAIGLRITRADEEAEEDTELLQILLRKAAANIDRRQTERTPEPGQYVRLDSDEYRALLALAKRGIAAMQSGAQP